MGDIAKEVIGVRAPYSHFATMHIVNTKRGTFFLSDTQINKQCDADTLYDIARLTRNAVEYYAHKPVMALCSYSTFGSSDEDECRASRDAVARMQQDYPDLAIEGEMALNFALNKKMRDTTFPFNRIKGMDVNTLIFPNLSSASAAYRMMLEMGVGEAIGPIQMGLNKPVHFISIHASVRSILNLAIIAGLDAAVLSRQGSHVDL